MATIARVENLANDLAVPKTAIERYVAAVEEVFLVKPVPA